jgi:hypothetical protein
VNGIPQIGWVQADNQAIQYNAAHRAWLAGIVKDILTTPDGSILVATDTGGIWSVSEAGEGVCLIDTDKPDMWCLARGPDGNQHVFAGGQTDGWLTLPRDTSVQSRHR